MARGVRAPGPAARRPPRAGRGPLSRVESALRSLLVLVLRPVPTGWGCCQESGDEKTSVKSQKRHPLSVSTLITVQLYTPFVIATLSLHTHATYPILSLHMVVTCHHHRGPGRAL